jgi:MFS family permease
MNPDALEPAPLLPIVLVLLAQIQMSFNLTAVAVSLGGIVGDLNASPTSVSAALVVYSLCVAAFVMLGARVGRIAGERLVFRAGVAVHGLSMAVVALSPTTAILIAGQAVAGLAAAVVVPSLVVLIAANYSGRRQVSYLGLLAGAPAIANVLGYAVAGTLGALLVWRYAFGLMTLLAGAIVVASFRLGAVERQPRTRIDGGGALLVALAVVLLSLGFQALNTWGALFARPSAPFDLLGLSPALFAVVAGLILFQAFFWWCRRRESTGRTALLPLEVVDSPFERNAVVAFLIIGALGAAVDFLFPLYMQIVQGKDSLQTALAAIPYTLAVFGSAVSVGRLYDHLSSRQIGCAGFLLASAGLGLLAFTVGNEWGTPLVVAALLLIGVGHGALLTLLFNILASESPKRLAGDVGALRGTANNLSSALGTATATLLSVGLLTLLIIPRLAAADLPSELTTYIPLDRIEFVSNDRLAGRLEASPATAGQIQAALDINTDARRQALRETFLILAAAGLLAVIPSLRLPRYSPANIPVDPETPLPAEAEQHRHAY